MAKYVIWDKKSDIYTLAPSVKTGKMHWTAKEYIAEEAPWAGIPGVKVMVGGAAANGGFFLDFEERKTFYKARGVAITDDMTDDEVLAAMEAYDNAPGV